MKGQFIKESAVHFERIYDTPIETVFKCLTDTKGLAGWFGEDCQIEPRVGGSVRLMGGHIRGTVTQWAPPHKLAYTWNVFDPQKPEQLVSEYPESYLTFTLEERDGKTVLTLTHLPVLERFEKQNAMGWHTFLDMLGALVAGETPMPRGSYMKKNAELYGVDLENLAR